MLILLTVVLVITASAVLVTRVLHPHHRKVAIGLYLSSWVTFLVSVWQHRALLQSQAAPVTDFFAGYSLHIALLLGMLLAGYVAHTLLPPERSPLTELPAAARAALVRQDLTLLSYLLDRIQGTVDALLGSGLLIDAGDELSRAQRQALRQLWSAYVEVSYELDALKTRHRTFYQLSLLSPDHAGSFLVAYGALAGQYHAELQLTTATRRSDRVRTLLDEPVPEHALPAGTYSAIQGRSMHPDTLLRLNAGRLYLKVARRMRPSQTPLAQRIYRYLIDVQSALDDSPSVFIKNPLDYLERQAFESWFPLQKKAAQQVSLYRATDRPYFISPATIAAHAGELEPGDILLERREWHLTNLGIPGYWTHAALYLGTPAALDAHFAGLPVLEGRTATAWLAEREPAAVAALAGRDEHGPLAVIEAIRPGVVLSSLEHSGSCDSLAVLRAGTSRRDQLQVVREALRYLGRPYDYNFDFTTDSALVCSELVYKAYQDIDGLTLHPEEVNGRVLLSPNQLAIKFDEERDGPSPELSLVLFLDGRGDGEVIEQDAAAFRQSWRRPKWHILLT